MRGLRKTLRVFGILAGVIVGLLVVAVVVSQTAWFRDWLRRYAMREADQFINGQLMIGRVEGGLWGGVQLHDVRITRDGETVIAFDLLDLEYSLLDMVRQGPAIAQATLVEPVVHLRRDDDGSWNIADLLVEQEPADPDAPRATFRVDDIELREGVITIEDPACPPSQAGCLPERIEGLRLDGRVASDPEALELAIDEAALRTSEPDLALERLATRVRLTDTNLAVESLELRTRASQVTGEATVENLDAETPRVQAELRAEPLALSEVGRFVPALEATTLTPTIRLSAQGPLDQLAIDLETTSEAGRIVADVVADAAQPGYAVDGQLTVDELNVGAWIGDETQTTNLSANADVDVRGSDLATLSGTVSLDASRLEAQGYVVDALDATARITDGVATLDAEARAYGTSLTSAGTVDFQRTAEGGDVAFDLAGAIGGLNVAQLPASLGAPDLPTNVSLDYDVEGTPSQLRVDAAFERSTVDRLVILDGSRATLRLNDGRTAYDVDAQVRDVDVQRLGQVLDIAAIDDAAYASDLNGRIVVTGEGTSLESAVARAEVRLSDSTFGGARLPEFNATVAARRGAVDAQVSGRLAELRPELISGRDDIAGLITGRFDVSASVPDVTAPFDPAAVDARADVVLEPSEVAGLTIEEARLDASLTDGVGAVRTLRVQSPALVIEASGPVSLVEGQTTRLTYDVQVRQAGRVASLAGVDGVAGSAQLQGTVEGEPARLTADGTLSLTDVIYQATASVARLQGTYVVTVPDLEFGQVEARVQAEATGVDVQDTTLDSVQLEARYAEDTATFDVDLTQGDLQAGAAGQVALSDAGQDVTLSRLSAQAPRLSWSLADGSRPTIRHADGRVEIDGLTLADGRQRITVDGDLQLPGDDTPLRADNLAVDLTDVDVAPIGEQFAPTQELAGRLDATVRFSGTLADGSGTAEVTLRDAGVSGFAFESLTASADIADAAADVDATLRQNPTSILTVAGRVPLPTGEEGDEARRLDLTVGGPGIDLAVLEGVTDQVEDVRGRLIVDARVSGTLQAPEVDGVLRVQDGALSVPIIRTTYEGIQADVRVTPDLVQVDQFNVRDGEGNALGVSGTLALEGTTPGDVALQATASEFRLFDNELGDVRLTTDLSISGTADAPVVRGEVALPNSLVDIDRLLLAIEGIEEPELRNDQDFVYEPGVDAPIVAESAALPPPTIDLNETNEPARDDIADQPQAPPDDPLAVPASGDDGMAPQPSLVEASTIDVRVRIPNDLVVRGDDVRVAGGPSIGGMNITLGADLRATSDPGEPLVVTGEITTVRGYYDFQGRRFNVVRDSAIIFDGPDYTDPSLDLTATRDISGVEARVTVVGTAQDPRLELSSTPALDEADILALIVFNRPLDDLGSGEQVSLAQRAGQLVGGQLTSGLATSLRDAIGVDQFEIDAFGESGPNVTLGNRLGERIYVRIRQQLGAQDLSQILLEYELLQNLRLQTSITQGASTDRSPGQRVERSGIDLLYFFYY